VTRNGKSEEEVRRRIQQGGGGGECMSEGGGSNADRKMSRKLKGKVQMLCVTSAYLYSLEMVAVTERQKRLQVSKNNCVRRRRISGVKRGIDELREEICVQMSMMERWVKWQQR